MRWLALMIVTLTLAACGGGSSSSTSTLPAPTVAQAAATSTALPATATATVPPTATMTPGSTATTRPTTTPWPTPRPSTPRPTTTPQPTATPRPTVAPTPISVQDYGDSFKLFMLNALTMWKAVLDTAAIPPADRGQFWQAGLITNGQKLRDYYDQSTTSLARIAHPPNDAFATIYTEYVAALKLHADAFDAYKAGGDLQSYDDAVLASGDALTKASNDLADYLGLP